MNFFVISDIHGSIEALEKAMERFQVEKADYIIICGDFLNHGPRNPLPKGYNTKAVAEKLNSIKDKIICVRDILSIRKKGKYIVSEDLGKTKKDRIKLKILKYK